MEKCFKNLFWKYLRCKALYITYNQCNTGNKKIIYFFRKRSIKIKIILFLPLKINKNYTIYVADY